MATAPPVLAFSSLKTSTVIPGRLLCDGAYGCRDGRYSQEKSILHTQTLSRVPLRYPCEFLGISATGAAPATGRAQVAVPPQSARKAVQSGPSAAPVATTPKTPTSPREKPTNYGQQNPSGRHHNYRHRARNRFPISLDVALSPNALVIAQHLLWPVLREPVLPCAWRPRATHLFNPRGRNVHRKRPYRMAATGSQPH